MNGRHNTVPYFCNWAHETGITLEVHGKKYLHDYCLCDTACSLIAVSKDTAEEMGLTPSSNHVQLYQVAGVSSAGVYNKETVSAIWCDGTSHAATLHTGEHYLILANNSPLFKVLVGVPLLNRVAGRPCPALNEFGLHPYFGRGMLQPAFTIPLCSLPPRQLQPGPAVHFGTEAPYEQLGLAPPAGRDWMNVDTAAYSFTAVASEPPRRPRTRRQIHTFLHRSGVEPNPGP